MSKSLHLKEQEVALARIGLAMLAANIKLNQSYDLGTWIYILETAGFSKRATPLAGVTVEDVEAAIKEFDRQQIMVGVAEQALIKFCCTVVFTGGVKENAEGFWVPVNDPDWIDLGEVYAQACAALELKINEDCFNEAGSEKGCGDADPGA